jgi:DNA replication and repair protein RecF
MVVGGVECRGFRNLVDDHTPIAGGVVVVHGPNGAGKTNLLEALYFGLTGRSFRAGNDRDMIRFGDDGARVELDLEGGSKLLAAIDRSGERRHLIAGRPLAGEPGERPLVSVFHPDRLQLVKGSPAHRRAHLDRLCGAIWPARADLRARFGRTLAQRNALVQRIKAGLGGDESLPSWDERLASEAEPLMEARAEAVGALGESFSELAGGLGLPDAEIAYRPRAAGGREELVAELASRRSADLGRAYTSYGPPARRGGAPARRQAAAPLRLAGPAAAGATRPALRGARGADGSRSPGPADAPG